mmetsp:Transcript_11504/g.18415  ORF Transcript_11504/g.18415 Transcript_11504/m.18415 type:complete len:170 (-) Transcript_11504:128-637(-)
MPPAVLQRVAAAAAAAAAGAAAAAEAAAAVHVVAAGLAGTELAGVVVAAAAGSPVKPYLRAEQRQRQGPGWGRKSGLGPGRRRGLDLGWDWRLGLGPAQAFSRPWAYPAVLSRAGRCRAGPAPSHGSWGPRAWVGPGPEPAPYPQDAHPPAGQYLLQTFRGWLLHCQQG